MTRPVVCTEPQTDHGQEKVVLPDSDCDPSPRPSEYQNCDLRPCLTAEWMASEWLGVGAWIIPYKPPADGKMVVQVVT